MTTFSRTARRMSIAAKILKKRHPEMSDAEVLKIISRFVPTSLDDVEVIDPNSFQVHTRNF